MPAKPAFAHETTMSNTISTFVDNLFKSLKLIHKNSSNYEYIDNITIFDSDDLFYIVKLLRIPQIFNNTLLLFLLSCIPCITCFALVEGKLGKVDASVTLRSEYDSRVFGISSDSFQGAKSSRSSLIAANELKSEDDFVVRFSPALHFSKKLKWFSFTGTAGVDLVQYIKNNDKSYTQHITTFSIDFDDTLSKNKRVSNNAKIRFDATFDLGQSVGASILEQDLTSYTYFVAGVNVRYNHSAKFGLGGGTSYNLKHYQSGATQDRVYQDISTLPLSAQAFYIYSEKLDFYTDYTFTRTKDDQSGSNTLTDSSSHSISFGTQGDYSSKLSGNAKLGYSVQNFDNEFISNQDNLITSIGINWKLNTKTSFGFNLDRSFSPSAQGFSTFSTMGSASATHRLLEDLSAKVYVSAGNVNYTYPPFGSNPIRDSSSLNQYGLGFNLMKQISERISATTGYDYSFIDRSMENYARHVLHADITGRF